MNDFFEEKVHAIIPEITRLNPFDMEGAISSFRSSGKSPKEWAGEFEPKGGGVLSPIEQILVLDNEAIVGFKQVSSQAESIEEPYQSWRKFMEAPDWAHDVGGIRADLGEIEEIYKDFDHIYSRFNGIADVLPPIFQKKMINALGRAYKTLQGAESLFREVTHTGKAPRRNPIVHSQPTVSPKQEMERISMDLAKLSVRVRNIGQATADVEHVEIKHVRDMFEKASEILRRTFVEFERHIP